MEVLKLFSTEKTKECIGELVTIAPLVWCADGMFCKELSELIGGRVPKTITIKFKTKDNMDSFKRAINSIQKRPDIRFNLVREAPAALFNVDQLYLAASGLTVRGNDLSLDGVIHSIRKMECICLKELKIDKNDNPMDTDTVDTLFSIGEKQESGWTVLSQLGDPVKGSERLKGGCGICRDVFVNPKILPLCGHVYCTECIDGYFKNLKEGNRRCPMCNKVHKGEKR